jgi:hypothetical protein
LLGISRLRSEDSIRRAFAEVDARGKRRRRYKPADYATPYEKLKSLPEAEQSGQQLHAKQKGAFPWPPTPQVFRIILYWKRKSFSGSSFDWKMLAAR